MGESYASQEFMEGSTSSSSERTFVGQSQEGTVVQRIAWADVEDSDEG